MADAILLDHFILPKLGPVHLQINWSFDIKITAEEARQKVDDWLLDQVSTTIGAGEPLLVVDGDAVVWRVPAIFTATHVGEVGVAGTVDVDVQTGLIKDRDISRVTILQNAQALAKKMPAYVRRAISPTQPATQDVQPTISAPKGDPFAILAAIG
ncbi:MAG: hypothetical protein R2867_45565 [Caldilineaceae bacterium]